MNNDLDKIRVVCESSCPFVVYTFKVNGSTLLQVKTCRYEHAYSQGSKNIHVIAKWLAKRYVGQLRMNPN